MKTAQRRLATRKTDIYRSNRCLRRLRLSLSIFVQRLKLAAEPVCRGTNNLAIFHIEGAQTSEQRRETPLATRKLDSPRFELLARIC